MEPLPGIDPIKVPFHYLFMSMNNKLHYTFNCQKIWSKKRLHTPRHKNVATTKKCVTASDVFAVFRELIRRKYVRIYALVAAQNPNRLFCPGSDEYWTQDPSHNDAHALDTQAAYNAISTAS